MVTSGRPAKTAKVAEHDTGRGDHAAGAGQALQHATGVAEAPDFLPYDQATDRVMKGGGYRPPYKKGPGSLYNKVRKYLSRN